MKTFNRVDCIKWSVIGLILGLSIILATSCSSPSRQRAEQIAKQSAVISDTIPQDTVWQCSVTGYNEGEFVIQRPNIYYKCGSIECLKALDKISKDFYVSCDSVVIYKQQITLLDYN